MLKVQIGCNLSEIDKVQKMVFKLQALTKPKFYNSHGVFFLQLLRTKVTFGPKRNIPVSMFNVQLQQTAIPTHIFRQ